MEQEKKQITNHQVVEKLNSQKNKRAKRKMEMRADNQKVKETKDLKQKKHLLKVVNKIVKQQLLKVLKKLGHRLGKKISLKRSLKPTKRMEMRHRSKEKKINLRSKLEILELNLRVNKENLQLNLSSKKVTTKKKLKLLIINKNV